MWAQPTLYQPHGIPGRAASIRYTGTDPDRSSFTTALETATTASANPAQVKCATSRYPNHGDERPHIVTVITDISVTVRTCAWTWRRDAIQASGRRSSPPHIHRPETTNRRQLITAIIPARDQLTAAARPLTVIFLGSDRAYREDGYDKSPDDGLAYPFALVFTEALLRFCTS